MGYPAKRRAWRTLLEDRLQAFFPAEFEEPHVLGGEQLQEPISAPNNLKPGPRLFVIRTLIDTEATSSRVHEAMIIPCVCCGEAMSDKFTHLVIRTGTF